jgi:hypothetical protein
MLILFKVLEANITVRILCLCNLVTEMTRYVPQMLQLVQKVFNRTENTDAVLKGAVGLLG